MRRTVAITARPNCSSGLAVLAREENFRWVVDGTNLDDLGDHRPGMRARREQGVRSPLVEAKITKEEVRACSREYGLPRRRSQPLRVSLRAFPMERR
jgi:uncharacterized protein